MVKYILKRIGYSILILFAVSIILYFLVRLMPEDFVTTRYADKLNNGAISPEQFQAFKAMYGLDDPSFLGILKGYWSWLGKTLSGDLGLSFKYEEPVAKVIGDYMWISFGVALAAYILQFLIAIPLGIKAATNQYGVMDYTTSVFSMIGISLPSFFLAILLIKVFSYDLGWFPAGSAIEAATQYPNDFVMFLDVVYHMILPMIAIVIGSIGGLMRHTRTNTLEVLNQDYIRTARAKGLSEKSVIYKHVFRNTMVPIVTMAAGIIPSLFGGMMILEQVFELPGIGQKAYLALKEGDVPFIMGYNMFLAILTVIGTLLSDLSYMLVDPRIKITK